MAEEWQALAEAANSALAEASAHPHGHFLNLAASALGFRRFQMGLITAGTHVPFPFQSVDLDGPSAMLRNAWTETARYSEIHGRLVRVHSVYGELIGALTDGPLWQQNLAVTGAPHAADPRWVAWAERRAEALLCADQATHRLRRVAAYDLATVDAFAVARTFPENSPSFHAWMRAAENLAERAKVEVDVALESEATMYSAVAGERQAGSTIFNP